MSAELDTINRRLLEGARDHVREAVFARRDGNGGWEQTPDWRADRHALRVALALGEGLGVGPGDVVALWMPLGLEWPIVERGVWALGAVSLALPPEWSVERVREAVCASRGLVVFCETAPRARELGFPEGVRALVALEGEGEGALLELGELMEQGGVLDTPERATRCRAAARAVAPDRPASFEVHLPDEGVGLAARTQGEWARAVQSFLARYPPRGVRCLLSERPDAVSRLVLYAGWADGRTRTVLGTPEGGGLVFGQPPAGTSAGSFVSLSELEWRAE